MMIDAYGYEQYAEILASGVGADNRLSLSGVLDMFQNIATAHSAALNVDADSLREQANAFWVVTKNRIRFYEPPKYLDKLHGRTWVLPRAKVTVDRCYRFVYPDGRLCVEGRSEWAILDLTRHTVRRLDSTPYPTIPNNNTDSALPYPFLNLRYKPTEDDFVYCHTVMASDVDMSQHTNNTVYSRIMQNAFPCEFYLTHDITDFEIAYRHESREGAKINLYRHDEEDGSSVLCTASPEGVIFAVAEIKYKTRG